MDVLNIVDKFLDANKDKYDGLVHADGACACLTGNIAPCGDVDGTCEPGYRTEGCSDNCAANGDCDWHVNHGSRPV